MDHMTLLQDLGLAQNAATQHQQSILLGSVAHQLYRLISQSEYSELDFSSVFKYLEQ